MDAPMVRRAACPRNSRPGSQASRVFFSGVFWSRLERDGPPLPPAVPAEPIPAIVEALRSHQLVALFDAHDNQQAHEFQLSLIRDPRFAATVDDIVVTIGNARYSTWDHRPALPRRDFLPPCARSGVTWRCG